MSSGVLRQIAELQSLSLPELKERWRELYGTEPPGYRSDMLVRRLAYRLQELTFGGLSEATRAKLRQHIDTSELDEGRVTRLARRTSDDDAPAIGTRFIREWRGERHEVTVVEGGFEYLGRRFRSLSAIARDICQVRINGPAFFGLRRRRNGTKN